jgi:PPOX class probable F420-dependent enzyme
MVIPVTPPDRMTHEEREAFLAEPRNVMVAALRPDGRPQVTPNWFLWDGAKFYVTTTKNRQKYRNFLRDPRVQLVIDESKGRRTIILDGTVELWDDMDRALPYFMKITEKYRGGPVNEATLRQRFVDEQRVLIVVTPLKAPEQWTSWAH